MGFRVDKEIKVVLEAEGGELTHLFRLPTAEEWIEYSKIDTGETEVNMTDGKDAQIKKRVGIEALEARVYLYDKCLLDAEGYEDEQGPLSDRARLIKLVPAPHKMAAVKSVIEAVKILEEKVKN